MQELTALNVEQAFTACLFSGAGIDARKVIVEGVSGIAGFHLDQVHEQHQHISDFLDQLPAPFHEYQGGGASFFNMCVRQDGHQWTDLQLTMDKLLCMGMAIGRVRVLVPRSTWAAFPGGMPLVVVSN